MLQIFLSRLFKKEIDWRHSRTAAIYGENGEERFVLKIVFVHAAARGRICAFTLKIVNTLIKNVSRDNGPFRSRHKRINPRLTRFVSGKASECRWRPPRYQVDPCSTGRDAAHGVLLSSPKPLKKGLFFAIGEGSRIFVACFLHSSGQMCLYQTPGRGPPRITGHLVNTAVITVHVSWRIRCFCRSTSVEDLESPRFKLKFGGVFSGRPWLNICPGNILFVFFLWTLVWNFCLGDFCAHSERYKNIMAGIVKIQICFGNIAFPWISRLLCNFFLGSKMDPFFPFCLWPHFWTSLHEYIILCAAIYKNKHFTSFELYGYHTYHVWYQVPVPGARC